MLCRTAEELFARLADRVGAIPGVRAVEAVPTLRQVKTLTHPRHRSPGGMVSKGSVTSSFRATHRAQMTKPDIAIMTIDHTG